MRIPSSAIVEACLELIGLAVGSNNASQGRWSFDARRGALEEARGLVTEQAGEIGLGTRCSREDSDMGAEGSSYRGGPGLQLLGRIRPSSTPRDRSEKGPGRRCRRAAPPARAPHPSPTTPKALL